MGLVKLNWKIFAISIVKLVLVEYTKLQVMYSDLPNGRRPYSTGRGPSSCLKRPKRSFLFLWMENEEWLAYGNEVMEE
jgi:hypothetical protein